MMKMKKLSLTAIAFCFLMISTSALFAERMMQQIPQQMQQQMMQQAAPPPRMDEDFAAEVVMTINGEEVTIDELEEMFIGQIVEHVASAIDPKLAELFYGTEAGKQLLREYIKINIDDLQTQIVIRQEVHRQEIEISEEEKQEFFDRVDEQIEMMKLQQQVTEEQILQQVGAPSLETLKERVFEEQSWGMKVQKLLEAEVYADLEVTEEEARQFYDQQVAQMAIPEDVQFEDVKEQIKQHIKQVEGQEHVQQYIRRLKEQADIDIML